MALHVTKIPELVMLGLHVYGTNAHAGQECVDQRISESANDPENNSHSRIYCLV